jgi:hypothetical protein
MQTTVRFRATEEGGTCRHVYILGLASSTSAQAADSECKLGWMPLGEILCEYHSGAISLCHHRSVLFHTLETFSRRSWDEDPVHETAECFDKR